MPQLDGLRAVAMTLVILHHWLPVSWRWGFPTETGLFLFFLLSGFLMTQGLLRERETLPVLNILRRFHLKRLLRIYPAYFLALAVAALVGVEEIRTSPQWWMLNVQNFFILKLNYWPSGVSHFWTLGVEQQYYLFWPLLILFLPRGWMVTTMIALCVAALGLRAFTTGQGWLSMDLLPWLMVNYFALGSLLAVWMHRGVIFPHPVMDAVGLVALAMFAMLHISGVMGHSIPYLCHSQQTFLALAQMALVSRAAQGRCGWASVLLEQPWLMRAGQWSYGIYLFHNIAPLIVGKYCGFLWPAGGNETLWIWLRLPFFLLVTLFLTWICRRFVEEKFLAIKVR